MKKVLLISTLAVSISSVFAADNTNDMIPADVASLGQSASLASVAQATATPTDQSILPSQSVTDLSPSNSLKYPNAKNMFGSQLFKGAFASTAGSTFNGSYVINPGDNINLRLWGAYQFAGTLTVDPQGNIFVPNVGPVKVAGTSNANLQKMIEANVRKIYVANVGVYAALEQAQPVKVLVTGFVNQPGNYGGVANDTVLAYLDRAGGVDPERGSYVDINIMRNGKFMQHVNLYDFLIAGRILPFSFKDGDVIVVAPRQHTFNISGEVYNPYDFEFNVSQLTVAQALSVAKLKPGATNISIMRRQGAEYRSEYYSLADAQNVMLQDGDQVTVTADRYAGTIQVRVEGAHQGAHAVVLPYGSKLSEVLKQIKPNALSEVGAIQLYRPSVAQRQKEMLNTLLDKLEESTLNVNSSTQEESELRTKDAALVQKFVQKARSVQPKGQVVLDPNHLDNVILQQGDILVIPEQTSVIMVNGQVTFPNGIEYRPNMRVKDYIAQVGGFSQKSNKSKIIVFHQNGEALLVNDRYKIQQGDEILVLPKVTAKPVEIARGITEVLYRIALATKYAIDL
ncbi:polysaccharide biosynthesis/export family protein [Acinetobacter sp. ME22]|uniref:polysaccharide biosynthesis/export family protein n=1 Tax=Acinetobacter sp. ME22 TaxID=2904802 RepID=UPI001EDA0EE3|nr:polysaccharide biosynthesis/export family protein [Acinetobacter sp. ME22]MCG2574275.1 polysaccharide biosynthesis/export family protein [Acinetobacter sp. ME22]